MTTTRYNSLAETLRTAIGRGEFEPAGELPTEAQLCAQYELSRSTVRKALNMLRDDGLIDARQGSGWSVSPRHGTSILRLSTATKDHGDDLIDRVLHSERTRPPKEIAKQLGATARNTLLRVERVSLSGQAVVHRSTTWFNHGLSGVLDHDAAIRSGPAQLLTRQGFAIGEIVQLAGAMGADGDDRDIFGVELSAPILVITRLVHDSDGDPLFVSIHRHPGDSVQVQIELPTSVQGAAASLHAVPLT